MSETNCFTTYSILYIKLYGFILFSRKFLLDWFDAALKWFKTALIWIIQFEDDKRRRFLRLWLIQPAHMQHMPRSTMQRLLMPSSSSSLQNSMTIGWVWEQIPWNPVFFLKFTDQSIRFANLFGIIITFISALCTWSNMDSYSCAVGQPSLSCKM